MGWLILIKYEYTSNAEVYMNRVYRDYDIAYKAARELYLSDLYTGQISLIPVEFDGLCDKCYALYTLQGIKNSIKLAEEVLSNE